MIPDAILKILILYKEICSVFSNIQAFSVALTTVVMSCSTQYSILLMGCHLLFDVVVRLFQFVWFEKEKRIN